MDVTISLDFEHTDGHIFQIGSYCLDDHDTFYHSVNPGYELNSFAISATKLTDEDLKDCPTWATVGPMWFSWLRSKVKEEETLCFLGHNFNGSEVKCLKTSFIDYPETLEIFPDFVRDATVVDTLTIAKRRGMKDNRQENVYQNLFGKLPERAHDALDDAKCCAEIAQHESFRPMWDSVKTRMGGNGRVKPTWEDIFKDTVTV
jgi:DNA polymerase III epsilon subunit-like protein